MIMSIKEIIKDNTVDFDFYKMNMFYYVIKVDGKTFQFTVDREDIGTAVMLKHDKAIFFMRWIRKAIDTNTFIELK